MASGVYRKPPQEPLSFNDTSKTLVHKAKEFCAQYNQAITGLIAQIDPETAKFDNFLLPVAHLNNDWICYQDFIKFYAEVSPNEEIRDASREAAQIFSAGETKKVDISPWVKTIYGKDEELDPESQKFLNVMKEDNTESEKPTFKDRLKAINKRIADICVDFNANLHNENGGFWASKVELVGVPSRILDELQRGTGDNVGKFRVVYKWTIGLLIMEYAMDPGLRKKLYLGRSNSCNNNVPLFKEIISLRQEIGTLFGKPDYMTYKMQNSMLGRPDAVLKLLARFQERVANIGVLESLKETKLLDPNAKDKTLYLWDEAYYKRKWLEKNYSVDQQKIAEYFPVWSTINGMLQIYGDMFGLNFQHVVNADIWHEDVKLFAVWDKVELGGEFSGYLYVDPYPRLGKYRGACCFELQPSFLNRNGDRIYGVSALVCNFSKTLVHTQIITLFHELGHGIHHLLSRATYAKFHGARFTKDFNEIPSILLENWCWLPAQLKRLSRHCDTGATIPDDLVNNLQRTKYFARVLDPLQVALATFDLVVHTLASQMEVKEIDPSEIYNKILCEITGLKGPDPIAGVNVLGHGHVVRVHHVSGYPATYYRYIASYCFAEKIWNTIFAKDPMNKDAAMRYRRLVLEKGGTQEPLDMLKNLLGERLDGENLCD